MLELGRHTLLLKCKHHIAQCHGYMATSKINCTDYYKAGDSENIGGIFSGMAGVGARTVSLYIPLPKSIPSDLTVAISGLSTAWMRSERGDFANNPYKGISKFGSTGVLIEYSVPDSNPREIIFGYINGGKITFS